MERIHQVVYHKRGEIYLLRFNRAGHRQVARALERWTRNAELRFTIGDGVRLCDYIRQTVGPKPR